MEGLETYIDYFVNNKALQLQCLYRFEGTNLFIDSLYRNDLAPIIGFRKLEKLYVWKDLKPLTFERWLELKDKHKYLTYDKYRKKIVG